MSLIRSFYYIFKSFSKFNYISSNNTGVVAKHFLQIRYYYRISVKMHQPKAIQIIKYKLIDFKNKTKKKFFLTYCPRVWYIWCFRILVANGISPQFSNPLTTPPLSRTYFAEFRTRSLKFAFYYVSISNWIYDKWWKLYFTSTNPALAIQRSS
jgi:hypothetical protein